jgi:hypothetical protein
MLRNSKFGSVPIDNFIDLSIWLIDCFNIVYRLRLREALSTKMFSLLVPFSSPFPKLVGNSSERIVSDKLPIDYEPNAEPKKRSASSVLMYVIFGIFSVMLVLFVLYLIIAVFFGGLIVVSGLELPSYDFSWV